jgi:hypothetical protein
VGSASVLSDQRVAPADEIRLDERVEGYAVRLSSPSFPFDRWRSRRDRKAEALWAPDPFRDGAVQPEAARLRITSMELAVDSRSADWLWIGIPGLGDAKSMISFRR